MIKGFRKGIEFLVFSNVYVAVPILSLVLATTILFPSIFFDTVYFAFIFFSTLFIYPFHRLLSLLRIEEENYSYRLKSIVPYKRYLYMIVLLSIIGMLYTLFDLSYGSLLKFVLVGVISIGYSIPFIPWEKKYLRLRDLPAIKVLFIAFVVSYTTLIIPLEEQVSFFSSEVLFLFFSRFFFIIGITLPFDIRDIDIDRNENIKTIPVLYGKKRALFIAQLALCLSSLVLVGLSLVSSFLSAPIAVASILTNLIAMFALKRGIPFENDLYNAFVIEGMMVLYLLLLCFADYFFTL